ncbi:hypothetical protein [Bifidobacterium aquikefiricola]|uniref:Uncharacterized protein n=1 Tax=Bifidobacterium aquikefiricola TaxID=3059038 RepID=A0AB39U848_9BIFI
MVWAILIWLLVLAVLVIVVLWLARGESRNGSVSADIEEHAREGSEARRRHRDPRVAGSAPSFEPRMHVHPSAETRRMLEETSENPVYVNNDSVVEVHALFQTDSDEPSSRNAPDLNAAAQNSQQHTGDIPKIDR